MTASIDTDMTVETGTEDMMTIGEIGTEIEEKMTGLIGGKEMTDLIEEIEILRDVIRGIVKVKEVEIVLGGAIMNPGSKMNLELPGMLNRNVLTW